MRRSADRSANPQLGSDMGRQEHGGNADKAAKNFGFAPQDMLDLSTGISPLALYLILILEQPLHEHGQLFFCLLKF